MWWIPVMKWDESAFHMQDDIVPPKHDWHVCFHGTSIWAQLSRAIMGFESAFMSRPGSEEFMSCDGKFMVLTKCPYFSLKWHSYPRPHSHTHKGPVPLAGKSQPGVLVLEEMSNNTQSNLPAKGSLLEFLTDQQTWVDPLSLDYSHRCPWDLNMGHVFVKIAFDLKPLPHEQRRCAVQWVTRVRTTDVTATTRSKSTNVRPSVHTYELEFVGARWLCSRLLTTIAGWVSLTPSSYPPNAPGWQHPTLTEKHAEIDFGFILQILIDWEALKSNIWNSLDTEYVFQISWLHVPQRPKKWDRKFRLFLDIVRSLVSFYSPLWGVRRSLSSLADDEDDDDDGASSASNETTKPSLVGWLVGCSVVGLACAALPAHAHVLTYMEPEISQMCSWIQWYITTTLRLLLLLRALCE